MSFEQYIFPELVKVDSPACTKTAVLAEITRLFLIKDPGLSEQVLFDMFWQREQLGSTSIGHGMAIPHIRCPFISKPFTACLRLKHPVDFGGMDRQPCDLFIALIVPEQERFQHLALLSSISEKMSQADFRKACRQARSNEELFEIVTAAESHIA